MREVGKIFNCSSRDDIDAIVECLKKVPFPSFIHQRHKVGLVLVNVFKSIAAKVVFLYLN